jgi:hypothetical protein
MVHGDNWSLAVIHPLNPRFAYGAMHSFERVIPTTLVFARIGRYLNANLGIGFNPRFSRPLLQNLPIN